MARRNPFGNVVSTGCGGTATQSVCETRRVKSISRVKDEVIIAFDDCTYLHAPVSVVDASLLRSAAPASPQEVLDRVAELERIANELKRNLFIVKGMNDATSFYAFDPALNLEGLV